MKTHVTVVPVDKVIVVDNEAFVFDFAYQENIYAIQWHNGKGNIEYTDGTFNKEITEKDYDDVVLPYVALWEYEKQKQPQQEEEEIKELTPDQIIENLVAQFEQQIEDRLNSFAKTASYNSMLSCCTYATSAIPMYATEGVYCVNLRDMTWIKAYELINEMLPIALAGGHIPSWEEIEAQLPVPAWPEGSRNNP